MTGQTRVAGWGIAADGSEVDLDGRRGASWPALARGGQP